MENLPPSQQTPHHHLGVRKFPDLSDLNPYDLCESVRPRKRDRRSKTPPPSLPTTTTPRTEQRRPTSPFALPRPDLEAFDTDRIQYSSEQKVCPPTPQRTPAWVGSHRRNPEFSSNTSTNNNTNPLLPHNRLVRKSSLHATKMLLQLPVFRPSPETRLKFNEEYSNLGRIGFGNFSEVFCVRSKSDGNMYAVKKSKRRFLSKRDRAIWMKEVENFQRLGSSCEHIIEYYRAWQEEGYFFVQMELCERGNLEDFLSALITQKLRVPERTIWSWASHIISALHHIHLANVIHLDVKPQNVFLDRNGCLKLGDLGLARDITSTSTDVVEGDSRYMAPELLNASNVTTAVDIFSLGIMLFQISSSEYTKNLPNTGKIWRELRQDIIPPIRSVYSKGLSNLICAMMASNPTRRPSAKALLAVETIAEALLVQDNFVVTTPIKSCSSSPLDPTEMRRRCESGASDMSVWSTDSRDSVSTPMSCTTPRNASQSFMSSNMDSISTPRTILRSNQQRRHGVSTPSLRSAAVTTPWTRVKSNNNDTPSTVEIDQREFTRQGSITSPVVANLFGK